MSSSNNPRRNSAYSIEDDPIPTSRYTFTPCTRLAQMNLHSTSTSSGRTRYFACELKKPENLQTKLNRALQAQQHRHYIETEEYDDISNAEIQHPNLSMVLDSRIRMAPPLFSDLDDADESEDDGRTFSSPDTTPERDLAHDQQQQEAKQQHWLESSTPTAAFKDFMGLDDGFFDIKPDEFVDTTGEWVNQIHHDNCDGDMSIFTGELSTPSSNNDNVSNNEDVENRPPREWHSKKKIHRLMGQVRGPLQEVLVDRKQYEEGPPRKKQVTSMRFNRSLSPTPRRNNSGASSSRS
ncbi:hypothetical protein BX666DRAFT_1881647 [Dichotomocladium elegans]|nr:hypothetical protein BX666DRAFT_1881647 [Dichotomocladium elegans]